MFLYRNLAFSLSSCMVWFSFFYFFFFKDSLAAFCFEGGNILWFYMLFVLPWQGLIHGKNKFSRLLVFYVNYFLFDISNIVLW